MSATATKPAPTSLRIPPDKLARIDRLAKQHGLDRTKFMIGKALDELGSPRLNERVDELEHRIERLEHAKFLGA